MSNKKNYLNLDEDDISIISDNEFEVIQDNDQSINESDDIEDFDDDVEIEIDDNSDNYISEDTPIEGIEENDFDLIYKLNTNKHRQEGKHTLQRDTIFKGKTDKNQNYEETSYSESDFNYNDSFKLFDVEYDSYNDDYLNQNNLNKDVYDILRTKTDIDFRQNRRKPNKDSFNDYYNLLIKELGFRYTKSEIFVELSYYFTDNIFNMFKLLDKKSATNIIKELIRKGYLKNLDGINFI